MESKFVDVKNALSRLKSGMCIMVGSGPAEPRTLIKELLGEQARHLKDLELIQLISLADTLSGAALSSSRFRLKTFFSGGLASDAISTGRVDLIPSRFSRIPALIRQGVITLDAAMLLVTPPNQSGYCSLGASADLVREVIDHTPIVIAEVSDKVPWTYGNTMVHVSEFACAIRSTDDPVVVARWPHDGTYDRLAANVAQVIEDGCCLAFSVGPLYDALGRHLASKRNLSIHSAIFTDALMDLVTAGAVTNQKKTVFRGRSLASYAIGTRSLMQWLDGNPCVELQPIDWVFDPVQIGCNDDMVVVLPARRVDLTGRISLHNGRSLVAAGPAEFTDFLRGAELSKGGRTIVALPSRNREGCSQILLGLEGCSNQLSLRESVDLVVTEQGVANLRGRTMRERAQALIEIAHPEDRASLWSAAVDSNLLYRDQVFLHESARLVPMDLAAQHTFGDGVTLRFRALRPSDEEGMRRLFYRFSSDARYMRFFMHLSAMPHEKMQTYVNIDYRTALSIVGLVGRPGQGRIVAEARYAVIPPIQDADFAIFVDEQYQRMGIGTYLVKTLTAMARKRGITAFRADVLASNRAMLRVIEKCGLPSQATIDRGTYEFRMPLTE